MSSNHQNAEVPRFARQIRVLSPTPYSDPRPPEAMTGILSPFAGVLCPHPDVGRGHSAELSYLVLRPFRSSERLREIVREYDSPTASRGEAAPTGDGSTAGTSTARPNPRTRVEERTVERLFPPPIVNVAWQSGRTRSSPQPSVSDGRTFRHGRGHGRGAPHQHARPSAPDTGPSRQHRGKTDETHRGLSEPDVTTERRRGSNRGRRSGEVSWPRRTYRSWPAFDGEPGESGRANRDARPVESGEGLRTRVRSTARDRRGFDRMGWHTPLRRVVRGDAGEPPTASEPASRNVTVAVSERTIARTDRAGTDQRWSERGRSGSSPPSRTSSGHHRDRSRERPTPRKPGEHRAAARTRSTLRDRADAHGTSRETNAPLTIADRAPPSILKSRSRGSPHPTSRSNSSATSDAPGEASHPPGERAGSPFGADEVVRGGRREEAISGETTPLAARPVDDEDAGPADDRQPDQAGESERRTGRTAVWSEVRTTLATPRQALRRTESESTRTSALLDRRPTTVLHARTEAATAGNGSGEDGAFGPSARSRSNRAVPTGRPNHTVPSSLSPAETLPDRGPDLTVRADGRTEAADEHSRGRSERSFSIEDPNVESINEREENISPLEAIGGRHMNADVDIDRLVDRLYSRFERKLRTERQRRGL